jgi:hypothetical protein
MRRHQCSYYCDTQRHVHAFEVLSYNMGQETILAHARSTYQDQRVVVEDIFPAREAEITAWRALMHEGTGYIRYPPGAWREVSVSTIIAIQDTAWIMLLRSPTGSWPRIWRTVLPEDEVFDAS